MRNPYIVKDFSQAMSERTDKQLVDIVILQREAYQPEAIAAAEKEIVSRQIDVNTFYTEDEVLGHHKTMQADRAELAFKLHHKVFTILLPIATVVFVTVLFNFIKQPLYTRALGFPSVVLVHYLVYRRLKNSGYTQMAKDF